MADNNILDEAKRITAEDRQRYYGHPFDNHGNTASFWTAYLRRKYDANIMLSARDVCMMMMLLKISRDCNKENIDNLIDICGYARNAEMVDQYREEAVREFLGPDSNAQDKQEAKDTSGTTSNNNIRY